MRDAFETDINKQEKLTDSITGCGLFAAITGRMFERDHSTEIRRIADIKNPYTIHKADFVSKGKNTPFEGKEVKGKILYTICDGKIVYKDSAAK